VSSERASGAGDEVAALIARLRAEARASGLPDQGPDSEGALGPLSTRREAELMRWYVEPAFSDQRTFNAAVLRVVDEAHAQTSAAIAQLEERVTRLEERRSPDSERR
jgi:hypothetical protein